MLDNRELQQLGYDIGEDPDQPGKFYWRKGNDGSEISYDSPEEAELAANMDAGDAYRCDNCGRIHTAETLKEICDLAQRVDPNGPMPSGECGDCGALCYLVDDTPEWSDVMSHFGLDDSFVWGQARVMEYTRQYLADKASEKHQVLLGAKAFSLLEEADAYLRAIRTEELDGSEPELGELLERVTTLWIEARTATPKPDVSEGGDEVEPGSFGKLVTLDGRQIDRVVVSLRGTCGLEGATREAGGSIDLQYDDTGTDVDWNASGPLRRNGETIYLTSDGDEVMESQIKLVPSDE